MAFNRAYLEKVHKECLDLGEKKSNDYSSVADGIGICGLKGISVRLVDKVLRIASLTSPGINQQVKDESIRDTLLDVINYATYGVALMDGQWGLSWKMEDLATEHYNVQVGLSKSTKEAQLAYNRLASELCTKINIRKPKWKSPKKKKKK